MDRSITQRLLAITLAVVTAAMFIGLYNGSGVRGVKESRMYVPVPCQSYSGDDMFECKSPFVVSIDVFRKDVRLSELAAENNVFVEALDRFVNSLHEDDYGKYKECIAAGDESFRSEEGFRLFGAAASTLSSDPYVSRMYQSGPICVFAVRKEETGKSSAQQTTSPNPYFFWVFCKTMAGPAVFAMGNSSRTPLNSVLIGVTHASLTNVNEYQPRVLDNDLSEVLPFGIEDFLENAEEFGPECVYFQASNLSSVEVPIRPEEGCANQFEGKTGLSSVAESALGVLCNCASALREGNDAKFLSCIRPEIRQHINELYLMAPEIRETLEAMWIPEKHVLWCASGEECCILLHEPVLGGPTGESAVYLDRELGKYFLVSPSP